MIKLNGSTRRDIYFPADPVTTLRYFSDLSRVAFHLPHITVVKTYGLNEIRVHYQTVELGAYTINIYTDLVRILDEEEQVIYIQPLEDKPTVPSEATLNATTAYGYFYSTARLQAHNDQTHIDYRLKITAELPRPRGLRMMPGRVVNRIAESISQGRVREIADGFIADATAAFPEWLTVSQSQL